MKRLLFILLIHVCCNLFAQQFVDKEYYLVDSLVLEELSESDRLLLDSCLKLYHQTKQDTDKINALTGICENMMHDNWIKYQYYQNEILTENIYKKHPNFYYQKKANTLNNLGYYNSIKGNIHSALVYYEKAKLLYEKINDNKGLATNYLSVGFIYDNQGNVEKALELYHKGLMIQENIGDKQGIARSLNNIGAIYSRQNEIEKSLEYYLKSIALKEELGDKQGLAYSLNNIGVLYTNKGELDLALVYYYKSLKLRIIISDMQGMAQSLNSIGIVFEKKGELDSALTNYHKSLSIREQIGDKNGMVYSLNCLGFIQINNGDLKSAKTNLTKALKISQEIGYAERILISALNLSKLAKKEGNSKDAIEMYELYIQMRDSVKNTETQKAAIRQQTKYEFEKEQLIKEQKEKEEIRNQKLETERRNSMQYSIIFVAILVVFGLVLALGRINVSPKFAEGLIFFAFLIFFEFLLVLTDPYLDTWTGGAPAYKLLVNAVIAALIFPAHAFFEKVLKSRILKE